MEEPADNGAVDNGAVDSAADSVVELDSPMGSHRFARIGAFACGLVLVAFIAVLATSSGEQGLGQSPLIAKAAPAITGQAIDGTVFDLDAERGRWVVVNFFATTCVPCIREHPELIAFDEAHESVGDASVVSIAFSDSSNNVRDFFKSNGGEWSVLAEDTDRHAISYGVAAVPETYLVAPNGVVVRKFIGGITQEDLDDEILRLSQAVGAG